MASDRADAKVVLERAKQLANERQYGEALQLYLHVGQENPDQPEAWIGVAAIYLRQKHYPECLEAISRVLETAGARQARPHLIAAAAFKGMGRHADADRATDLALSLEPDHPQALNSKAGILLQQRRHADVLPLAERVIQLEPANLDAHLYRGIALQGLGHSPEALAAFERLLAIKPDHASALMNRSSVLITLGRAEEALQAANAALQVQPNAMIALLNKTAALLSLRRPREALAVAEQLLQLDSRHSKGLINKAIALLDLGNFTEALTTTLKALTFDSFNPDALELKIRALLGLRRFTEAVTESQKALSKYPDRILLKLSLAKALMGLDSLTEAESTADAILIVAPYQSEAVSLKAEILLGRNEWKAGCSLIEQALAAHPDQAQLWTAKSAILLAGARYDEALTAAERALALQPGHLQATINQIAALNHLQRFADALEAARALAASGIRDWQLYANLGGALSGLEHFEEAQQAFAMANELDPNAFQAFRWRYEAYGLASDALLPNIDPHAEYLTFKLAQLERCNWKDYEAILERATALIRQNLSTGQLTPLPPFKSLTLPLPLDLAATMARSRGDFLSAGMAATRQRLAFGYLNSGAERLKIGYVSADFRNHPTAHLMRSLFHLHDRERFEIFVYALCKDDGSTYYRQIKADADQFVDLSGVSNAEAAARVNADGIHILVDLMGYTAYARTEIFALQPAPIQVSYLGYPGTLGASFTPYILADETVLPETLQPYFTERPVYLPECYQVNDDLQEISDTGIQRHDLGLPETGFIFCCFNKPEKIDPVIFEVWIQILKRVPGSVLWLLASEGDVVAHLRREAEGHGIAGERLIFAERLPKAQHLERHRLADLFLDTRLYNAHTTASDALWAGLPVLTCLGETFPARVAASLLRAIGLPELITHSLEAYEELAVRLAATPTELAGLRVKLADNRLRTPLFNTRRFTRHLEQAYQLIWERHAQGLPPAPLRVTPLPASE